MNPGRKTSGSQAVLVLAVLLAGSFFGVTEAGQHSGSLAFTGARLFDGRRAEPVLNAVLVVRDGRIVAAGPADQVTIPADATRMDLSGRMILPGLVLGHGHVGMARGLESDPSLSTPENIREQLLLYARYGVTTVLSLGQDSAASAQVRKAQKEGEVDRARLLFAGNVIDSNEAGKAQQLLEQNIEMGADWIKIRVDDNLGTTDKLKPHIYRDIIESAHASELPVAAHVYYLDDARDLVQAGVDLIAHSIRDRPVDEELISLLRQHEVCVSPTLVREVSTFVYGDVPDFFEDSFFLKYADPAVLEKLKQPSRRQEVRSSRSARLYRESLPVASANLKKLSDSGVRIAFGTDSGPPGRFQGYFEFLEMKLMADAGLTPFQILKSASGDAADCLRLRDVGVLEPGRRADFLIVDGNPLQDVLDMRRLESVWINGKQIH